MAVEPVKSTELEDISEKPETIGDRVKSNIAEVSRIHALVGLEVGVNTQQLDANDGLLDQSAQLLAENEVLLSLDIKNKFSEPITEKIEASIVEDVAKVAAKMDANTQMVEMGKNKFIQFMNEITGIDFSDPSVKINPMDIFSAIMSMSEPGAMGKVMAKMQNAVNGMDPNAPPEEKFDAVKDAAAVATGFVASSQGQTSENKVTPTEENKGLGGVNNTAVTYNVDKTPDNPVGPRVMANGASIVETFTNNANASGSMVDSTTDPSVTSQPDFPLPVQEVDNRAGLGLS